MADLYLKPEGNELVNSDLKTANQLFRNGLYDRALSAYNQFQEKNVEIAWICDSNIKITLRRLADMSRHFVDDHDLLMFRDFATKDRAYQFKSNKNVLHLELKDELGIAETIAYKTYTITKAKCDIASAHNNTKNIALICDRNFVEATIVAAGSCIRNGGHIDRIFLLAVDCAEEVIEKAKSIDLGNVELNIIELDNVFGNIPSFKGLVTNAALFKFLLPYILNQCESVLYIDGDVLVTGDLAEIFSWNAIDNYACVAEDLVGIHIHNEHKRLGSAKYFNSGVMFLNLNKMRANAIPEKMIALKVLGKDIKYMDQDVFNICFGADVKYISHYYNFMTTNNRLPTEVFSRTFPEHQDDKIRIIHYTYKKPWSDASVDKAKYWYEEYRLTYGIEHSHSTYASSAKTDIWAERFLNSFLRNNSVLLIEAADCHGEVMPGFVVQLREMGFNVDVLFTNNNYELNSLSRIHDPSVRVYNNDKYNMYKFLDKLRISKYKLIIFTSRSLYYGIEETKTPTIYQYFPALKEYQNKIFSIEHHLEYVDATGMHNDLYGVLANPAHNSRFSGRVVNFTRFGNVKITIKNKITTFIVVGNIEAERKNHSLLIDALLELSRRNIAFKLIVVARRGSLNLPDSLRKSTEFHTNAPYEELYKLVEQADYILPMLDPSNNEHRRYLEAGTSGTFQLSYGFCKPCIIQKDFAEPYGFNRANSILYDKNTEFQSALISAISLDSSSYRGLQDALKKLADDIVSSSKEKFLKIVGHRINHKLPI